MTYEEWPKIHSTAYRRYCSAGLFICLFVGWLVRWLVGWLVRWLVCWLVGWLASLFVNLFLDGWLAGQLASWLDDWAGWLDGWLVGQLVDWLISLFVGWLIDLLVRSLENKSNVLTFKLSKPQQGMHLWEWVSCQDFSPEPISKYHLHRDYVAEFSIPSQFHKLTRRSGLILELPICRKEY